MGGGTDGRTSWGVSPGTGARTGGGAGEGVGCIGWEEGG